MKRFHLAKPLFILMVVITTVACSKHASTPTPTKTKTQLLTAHDWIETKEEFGTSESDLTPKPSDAQSTPFALRFTSTAEDAGTFISGGGNGTWALVNSETQLQLSITADPNNGISASTFTVKITFPVDGTIQLLYPIMSGSYGYVDVHGTFHSFAEQRLTFGPM